MKKTLLFLSLGALLAGCSTQPNSGTIGQNAAVSGGASGLGSSQLSDYDAFFIQDAAQQAADGIKLGHLILANGQSQGARDLGHRLVKDYTAASEELAQLAMKKGVTLYPQPNEHAARQMAELSSLSGMRFELMAAEDTTHNEKQDIRRFDRAEKLIQDPEVSAFEMRYRPLLQYHVLLARDI